MSKIFTWKTLRKVRKTLSDINEVSGRGNLLQKAKFAAIRRNNFVATNCLEELNFITSVPPLLDAARPSMTVWRTATNVLAAAPWNATQSAVVSTASSKSPNNVIDW